MWHLKSGRSLLIASIVYSSVSFGSDLSKDLKDWKQNPKLFMNKEPTITNAQGRRPASEQFEDLDVSRKRQIEEGRKKIRDRVIFGGRSHIKAAPDLFNDNPKDFLQSGLKVTRILELDKPELKSAKALMTPWSGDYWPIYKGGIASRYGDPSFGGTSSWSENFAYVQKNTAAELIQKDTAEALQNLSPAEKFDLISGSGGRLAKFAWREGEYYEKNFGNVESWFGICHGWAPASYIEPRPNTFVDVSVVGLNSKVRFLPSDLKALASQMWAKSRFSTRFIGGRCEERDVKTDEATGRILDKDCLDVNPMSWHLSLVHELGMEKRAFVIDASEDYQVWNQPVFEYKITYFNPVTAAPTENLADSVMDYITWPNDPYKTWRHPLTKKIVGIAVDVSYRTETSPSLSPSDSEEQDGVYTVRYIYDLELDEHGDIIGGEWYQRRHPDFIWTADMGARPLSFGDHDLEPIAWDPLVEPFPILWQDNVSAAARFGQIPEKILAQLIQASHKKAVLPEPIPVEPIPVEPIPVEPPVI